MGDRKYLSYYRQHLLMFVCQVNMKLTVKSY